MKFIIRKKHQNSKMCFVCGLKNNFGLKAAFYELENDELAALFTPDERHQGYPGRLHGGIASAILDETIGRAIMVYNDKIWGVTVDLSVSFRKPVPLNEELTIISRITSENKRFFKGTGELVLQNGDIAVTASGKYIKLPLDKIADFNEVEQEWKVIPAQNDPEEIII
ncbi:MAG: thioesterase [Candidatus Cloacimonas sp. SDB]|nr:MAG: thioesterase [Candidatus Cloacimonas sp. SDB]